MCGIYGFAFLDPQREPDIRVLGAMGDSIIHRGPDDAGEYVAPGVALGSRRLSILDLSPRGRMPMQSSDGRYWITYNGEVYNYHGLRAGLESRGYFFRSDTDTEVVVNLFAENGSTMLESLNGMFAVAIWDTVDRKLFLARDRMGVKPLYYSCNQEGLWFASEQKALFGAGLKPDVNEQVWEELICFRYLAGDQTPFRNVKRLLPGHWLTWRSGEREIRRWWSLGERAASVRDDMPADAASWYRRTFDDSIRLRRISDVPIGVLLSGGLDSSSVAASLAEQAGSDVASFTVRFREQDYDEGPVARSVAGRWRLNQQELTPDPRDLYDRLSAVCRLSDEPPAHGSDVYVLAIAKHAKSRVTVLLSGEGGDETLGGYVRYRPLRHPLLLRAAKLGSGLSSMMPLNGRLAKLAKFLKLARLRDLVLYNACDVLPADLAHIGWSRSAEFAYRETVMDEAERYAPGDLLRQAMYNDQHTFLCSLLDRNDRMTMGASIECRVPFLDYRLVEGVASLTSSALFAGRGSKPLLRRALGHRLPSQVLRYRKWGFAVPWSQYLRELPAFVDLLNGLPNGEPFVSLPLDRKRLRAVVENFLLGDTQHTGLVHQLAVLGIWYRTVSKSVAHGDFPRIGLKRSFHP